MKKGEKKRKKSESVYRSNGFRNFLSGYKAKEEEKDAALC